MLARVLAMYVCHKSELLKWLDRLSWFFGMDVSFNLSYTVLQGNSGISKYKGTSLWKFVLNSALRKILSWQVDCGKDKGGRSECDKLDCRQLTKLTIPTTVDDSHTDHKHLSIA